MDNDNFTAFTPCDEKTQEELTASGIRICPKCSSLNDIKNNVCDSCGYIFEPEKKTAPTPQQKIQKRSNYLLFYHLSLLIPIVGIILGIYLLVKSDGVEKDKRAGTLCIIFGSIITIMISAIIFFLILH